MDTFKDYDVDTKEERTGFFIPDVSTQAIPNPTINFSTQNPEKNFSGGADTSTKRYTSPLARCLTPVGSRLPGPGVGPLPCVLRFMVDLQAEVQEMEFLQFSKGMDTMRREDFAEWLLHYTNEEDNEAYWENMRKRIPAGQSITFEEFKAFCLFTNNLEDFSFSMKLVTGANRPVGMVQFKRAVRIATGHDLSDNVLDTVFKLFDMDGDKCLSHKEFMGVMTDRIRRGLKVSPSHSF
ncbi:calcium uptake protein 2, mitochondrial-like [Notothenia coriiceps]|uniref:Calcium uptake protein 2, mitochondrial-like n=1 Tax=Notothenia coriiceps TaxID=8208 RepID=A0A6I9MS47_9TELE|nr:PREDICTED: calcium uptake protein 2, mitochondrial-like [Notothenia coriiceps]